MISANAVRGIARQAPPPGAAARGHCEIFIPPGGGAEQLTSAIDKRLGDDPEAMRDTDITLVFAGRPPRGCLGTFESVAMRQGLTIVGMRSDGGAAALRGGGSAQMPVEEFFASRPRNRYQREKDGRYRSNATPLWVAGPLRSGVEVNSERDVVIVGDVNHGAEVRAEGNIVVLGSLRGLAHAGCSSEKSFILALNLDPQQLRIGSLIARSGTAPRRPAVTEIAYAADGGIIVETYQGRLPQGFVHPTF
ncbi:MAG: septum site-determining protein MinC [Nannocystaceae bacterium]